MQGPKRSRGCTFPNPGGHPPAGTGVRSIHRTAVYGPVHTVVWEGGAARLPLSRFTTAGRANVRSCTSDRRLESRCAMARKVRASRPSRAAEQADYKTWLADTAAALQLSNGITRVSSQCACGSSCMSGGMLRRRPPCAAVSAYNKQSPARRAVEAAVNHPGSRRPRSGAVLRLASWWRHSAAVRTIGLL
jgi:hypothetical protein